MISWITSSSLGTIEAGFVSELKVVAQQLLAEDEIKYALNSGSLPSNLTLQHDGTISGRIAYNNTGTYTFSITAIDNINTEVSTQTFTLRVVKSNNLSFTEAYFRPYLSKDKRREFANFVQNETIFEPSLIYRLYDPNFGVQSHLKMVLDFGIQELNADEYFYPLLENFYRKKLRLGEIKSAVAKDSSGTHIYDVIYAEVVDELVNFNNESVVKQYHLEKNDELYYPGSIDNMRISLQGITLDDWTTVSVDERLQPKFMLTQTADYRVRTYMKVVPICYTIPNRSNIIIKRIKSSGFKFNTVDFEIDRLLVRNTLDSDTDKYLIFNRQALGDLTDTDIQILGPEGWVRLDDENNQPLERE